MNTKINNANELKNEVSKWVNTLNFINLEVLEKIADNCLHEYIRIPEPDCNEFINSYSLNEEYEEFLRDNEEEDNEENKIRFCEDHISFERFRDEQENYPMWGTCFEFKESVSEDIIQAAINAGFGIIEGLEPFNTILFVSGAGYSFYSAHWIPLYLNLPWNEDIKESVERLNIDYSGM